MCSHAHCLIVPPHILEALARQGSLSCKTTLNDTRRILQKRTSVLNNLLYRSQLTTGGDRAIYDCENSYEQRLKLVRREGGMPGNDTTVNSAYDHSGYVRDYFKDNFGLNSIDGQGMSVLSNVHFGIKYNNAYWDGDEMTYGDGDGIDFTGFALALDVVAHELTHGVTQFLGNLEYYGQPGALNEHFSDVFASIIKQKFLQQQPSEADWLIGDTVVTSRFPGTAIRSLKEPGTANEFDRQPAHMDQYYEGPDDNQGVHINSGIPNKAFYLSATAIGMENASLIWFETLKNLWRTANFHDMLRLVLEVASRLGREGQVDAGAEEAIRHGFAEVGLEIQAA